MQRNALKISCLTDESFVYIRKKKVCDGRLSVRRLESRRTDCNNLFLSHTMAR